MKSDLKPLRTSYTVDAMIRDLERIRDDCGGDTPVLMAFQPEWPLQFDLTNIIAIDENENPDHEGEYGDELVNEDTDNTEMLDEIEPAYVCWLVASRGHNHNRSPYADKSLWEM